MIFDDPRRYTFLCAAGHSSGLGECAGLYSGPHYRMTNWKRRLYHASLFCQELVLIFLGEWIERGVMILKYSIFCFLSLSV